MPLLSPAELADFYVQEAAQGRKEAVKALITRMRPRITQSGMKPGVSFLDDDRILVLPIPVIGPDGKPTL